MSEKYIIAEVGSNWRKFYTEEDILDNIKLQIKNAAQCGASAVKFQLFTPEELYGPKIKGTATAKRLEFFSLPKMYVPTIKNMCDEANIDFMCTAFSLSGYRFINKFVKMHKIAAPEANVMKFYDYILSNTDKPILASDGCFDLETHRDNPRVIGLKCVSSYPCQGEDYDFSDPFPSWGISDHTKTNIIAKLASSMGATYFEKHVDLSQQAVETPDSCVSIGNRQFEKYCELINNPFNKNLRTENRNRYGRIKTSRGIFRPMPE